jgi:hypothetical protein
MTILAVLIEKQRPLGWHPVIYSPSMDADMAYTFIVSHLGQNSCQLPVTTRFIFSSQQGPCECGFFFCIQGFKGFSHCVTDIYKNVRKYYLIL